MWLVLARSECGWNFKHICGAFRLWMELVLSICVWMAPLVFSAGSIAFACLLFSLFYRVWLKT